MARTLSFDRARALDRATELFWKRGYVNTSVAQLKKAMRLGEGSFYNTFKSKRALYLECLDRYDEVYMRDRLQALKSDRSARERVYEFFDVVVSELATNKAPGCLATNSLSLEVLSDRELRSSMFERLGAFERYLGVVVRDGQRAGEIAKTITPDALARVLLTYLHGLHRLSVFEYDEAARRRETTAFLQATLGA